jgi:hypothetical protein
LYAIINLSLLCPDCNENPTPFWGVDCNEKQEIASKKNKKKPLVFTPTVFDFLCF